LTRNFVIPSIKEPGTEANKIDKREKKREKENEKTKKRETEIAVLCNSVLYTCSVHFCLV
jgi:hypothetical protein